MSGLSSNSAMEKPYSYASPSTCDDSITDELENVSIGSVECDARSRREFMEEPAPSEKAEIVMLSFLAFVLAFICLRYGLFSRQSFTFSNRAVSMLHAFTVLFLSSLGIQWSSPYERIGCNQNSPAEVRNPRQLRDASFDCARLEVLRADCHSGFDHDLAVLVLLMCMCLATCVPTSSNGHRMTYTS